MIKEEISWVIFFYVIPIAEIILSGYFFSCLVKPFMENIKGAYYVSTAYVSAMLILYLIPFYFNVFAAYFIGVSAAFFVMCRVDRRNYEQKAFLAVTFFAVRGFVSAVAEILYDNLYSFAENTDYMANHPGMWFALYVGVCIFYLLMEFVITAASIRCIVRNYVYKSAAMQKRELLMLTIPPVMGTAGYVIIWYYRRYYLSERKELPGNYDILSLIYYFAALIMIVVIIVLYQKIKAGQEEKLQKELLAVQIDSIRKHIEKVEHLYQDIRSVRHDMANHIVTLERLYAGNKTEEARAYRERLETDFSRTAGGIKSGNPVTDVILWEAQEEAEKRSIRFDIDFHFPVDSGVDAYDLSVILNNALQNAMEHMADEREPYLYVRSYRKDSAFMIEIGNRFTGSLQWDAESGLPVTTKKNRDIHGYGQAHGYGLGNIRRTAEKYAGDIAIDIRDDMFCLSVLLMTEPDSQQKKSVPQHFA